MNDLLHWLLTLWLYAVPTFAIILITKCTDVFLYKKLRMTEHVARLFFINFLTVEAAHILTASIEAMFAHLWKQSVFVSPFVLIPFFTLLPLITLYRIERKGLPPSLIGTTLIKRNFLANIVLVLLFDVSFGCFLFWHSVASWDEAGVIMGTVDAKLEEKWINIFYVGIIALIISFALSKIVVQAIITRKNHKYSIDLSTETT